jgi:hypothetical protein
MSYDNELINGRLQEWFSHMEQFDLPKWEQLPQLELYMDQLISQVRRYLSLFPEDEQNPVITPSIINNYVRLRVMPAPKRKRYGKLHIAYAIMICALKQVMTLTEIQKVLPPDLDEAQMRQLYNDFVRKVTTATRLFMDEVRSSAKSVMEEQNAYGCESLVLHSAITSMLYKLLTVKLTGLQGQE